MLITDANVFYKCNYKRIRNDLLSMVSLDNHSTHTVDAREHRRQFSPHITDAER